MNQYSIKDFENLSGIKSHTLRIWEQRYGLLKPRRTDTNIRYYDDNDLKLLLNVVMLNNNGVKISKISKMSQEEMKEEVLQLSNTRFEYNNQIDALTISMIELDEDRFEKIISTNILHYGFEQCMINIVYPFLTKIGILWQTGSISPAHEHFISNLIRQKIIVAIDGQMPVYKSSSKKYLLYLPEGELHELGLLFYNYVIKARNNKVVYLGQSLPFDDIQSIYKIHKPEYILTNITSSPAGDELQGYINKVAEKFSTLTILLTGYQLTVQKISLPKNVVWLKNVNELVQFIENQE